MIIFDIITLLFEIANRTIYLEYTCPEGMSKCGGGLKCIDNWRFCDGRQDCKDNSDEDPDFCAGFYFAFSFCNHQPLCLLITLLFSLNLYRMHLKTFIIL